MYTCIDLTFESEKPEHEDTILASVDLVLTIKVASRGRPAKTYGLPENCYPGEAAEFEIHEVDIVEERRLGRGDKLRTIKPADWEYGPIMAYVEQWVDRNYDQIDEQINQDFQDRAADEAYERRRDRDI